MFEDFLEYPHYSLWRITQVDAYIIIGLSINVIQSETHNHHDNEQLILDSVIITGLTVFYI